MKDDSRRGFEIVFLFGEFRPMLEDSQEQVKNRERLVLEVLLVPVELGLHQLEVVVGVAVGDGVGDVRAI